MQYVNQTLPNILPCNHIRKLSYVSRDKEGNRLPPLSAVPWRTGLLRYKWNANKQQRRRPPRTSEKCTSPAASYNYSSLILVTQCYCMLRQDIQASFWLFLQVLLYCKSSHCKSLRAWLWTLRNPISIRLHNVVSIFIIPGERGITAVGAMLWLARAISFNLCNIHE